VAGKIGIERANRSFKEETMLRNMIYLVIATTLMTMLMADKAQAWGAASYSRTYVGPSGGSATRTTSVATGPYGGVSHTGVTGVGPSGGVYHAGYTGGYAAPHPSTYHPAYYGTSYVGGVHVGYIAP